MNDEFCTKHDDFRLKGAKSPFEELQEARRGAGRGQTGRQGKQGQNAEEGIKEGCGCGCVFKR